MRCALAWIQISLGVSFPFVGASTCFPPSPWIQVVCVPSKVPYVKRRRHSIGQSWRSTHTTREWC
jgi:hypothetical protein